MNSVRRNPVIQRPYIRALPEFGFHHRDDVAMFLPRFRVNRVVRVVPEIEPLR